MDSFLLILWNKFPCKVFWSDCHNQPSKCSQLPISVQLSTILMQFVTFRLFFGHLEYILCLWVDYIKKHFFSVERMIREEIGHFKLRFHHFKSSILPLFPSMFNFQSQILSGYSGASARKARQRSTMGKKNSSSLFGVSDKDLCTKSQTLIYGYIFHLQCRLKNVNKSLKYIMHWAPTPSPPKWMFMWSAPVLSHNHLKVT